MSDDLVLVVDDDADIRTFLEVTLSLAGYPSVSAVDGEDGVGKAIAHSPSLILMDVMMPRVDGFEAIRRLRADGRTSHIPIICLTAKAQATDKVEGLATGADDYVTKPFDPEELVARVRSTLRRSKEMRTTSPLTGLPGNARIQQEIARRVGVGDDFALLYADLNTFKAYNDHYGFMRGDDVIRGLADVLAEAIARHGASDSFIGHVGGDDFVVVCDPDEAEPIAETVCRRFDELAPGFYDDEDRTRGYIEIDDRQGNPARFGFVSVSVGVVTSNQREVTHYSQMVTVATEMKSFAKKQTEGRSNFAVDRRGD